MKKLPIGLTIIPHVAGAPPRSPASSFSHVRARGTYAASWAFSYYLFDFSGPARAAPCSVLQIKLHKFTRVSRYYGRCAPHRGWSPRGANFLPAFPAETRYPARYFVLLECLPAADERPSAPSPIEFDALAEEIATLSHVATCIIYANISSALCAAVSPVSLIAALTFMETWKVRERVTGEGICARFALDN